MHGARVVAQVQPAMLQGRDGFAKVQAARGHMATTPLVHQLFADWTVGSVAKHHRPHVVSSDQFRYDELVAFPGPDLGRHLRSWTNADPNASAVRQALPP